MPVIRVQKTKNYTVMANYHLRDKRLSFKAKGLMSFMLSLPEKWDYSITGLSMFGTDKIDSVRNALKELEKQGYVRVERVRDNKGMLRGTEYTVMEKPILENPTLEKPILEKPILENPTQLSTKEESTKEESTKEVSKEERKELNLGSDGIYKLSDIQSVDQRSTNGIPSGSIGKVRLGKDSIGKNKKKKKPYLLDSYSKNEELISSLKDFIEMRKKIKAPMTERAVNLMLSKLSSMANDDTEKIKIINQSIMNSWKGIFPIKEEKRHDRFSARDDGEESIDWGAFDGA